MQRSALFSFVILIGLLVLTQCEQVGGEQLGPECFDCRCPRNLDYQCGSDGVSYQNECLFKCAQEKCPTRTRNVVITRKGPCGDDL